MKKILLKYSTAALFLGALTFSNPVQAQLGDAGEILKSGADDANLLLKSYLDPFGKGFGASMNTGWFTSAGTHKKLGFDLSLNVGAAIVPTSGLSFNVNDLGFNRLELKSGTSAVTPTVNGVDNTNTVFEVYSDPFDHDLNPTTPDERILLTEFGAPAGIGFEYVPAPMVQASLGLIKSTDITLRFIPETSLGDDFGNVALFGLGVKHGLNQWIPGGKLLPIDLSLQMGFTQLTLTTPFDVNPESGSNIKNDYDPSTWDDQSLDFEANAFTANVIVGKTLPFISGYVGLGFETSETSIATPGSFPITSVNDDYNGTTETREKKIEAIVDPIDISIGGDNNLRAFAGVQFKLAVLKIFANYTASTYSSFNAGFGITFR
tara:strand:+ start:1106 stop:2236 length:1131 start_codon:yes stop_codon:yes gene_type:complete